MPSSFAATVFFCLDLGQGDAAASVIPIEPGYGRNPGASTENRVFVELSLLFAVADISGRRGLVGVRAVGS